MVKRCLICGRYFKPDKRVGERQKACHRSECKKARKQVAQINWCRKNPGYFKGRYGYVKQWRKERKRSLKEPALQMIQDKIPTGKPVRKLVFIIPGGIQTKMIQDKIVLERLTGWAFAAHGLG